MKSRSNLLRITPSKRLEIVTVLFLYLTDFTVEEDQMSSSYARAMLLPFSGEGNGQNLQRDNQEVS